MKRERSPSFSLDGNNVPLNLYAILTQAARSILEPHFVSNQLREPKVLARKLLLYPDPTNINDAQVERVKEGILFISPLQYNLLGCTPDLVLEHRLASYVPFQCNFLQQGVLRVYFKHTRLRVKDDHLEWQLELDKYEFDDACYFGQFSCPDIPKEEKDRKYGICKGTRCPLCGHVVECDVHSKNKHENNAVKVCKRDHANFYN